MAGRQQGFAPRPNIIKVRQTDLDINRQTNPLVDQSNQQAESPYLNSNLIEDIEFTILDTESNSGKPTIIRHQLDREYRGWHVVRNGTPNVTFCEDSSSNSQKDTQLLLVADLPAAASGDLKFKISITVF